MSKTAEQEKAEAARKAVEKKLNDLGIPYDKTESTANLEVILHNHQNPSDVKPLAPRAGAVAGVEDEFEVGDPEELRPRTLPLVIKPKGGKDWKNPSQAEFARILNGYAYQNPKKWGKKKAVLLTTLKELGELAPEVAAERLLVLKGGEYGVKIGSELLKNADIK